MHGKLKLSLDDLRVETFETTPGAVNAHGTVRALCDDCSGCTDCTNCTECSNCSDCTNCTDCSQATAATGTCYTTFY